MLLGVVLLAGCNDEKNYYCDSNSTPGGSPESTTPKLSLDYGIKTFRFSWEPDDQTTVYRMFENRDEVSGFTQIGWNMTPETTAYDHTVALYRRLDAAYFLTACNTLGCRDSNYLYPANDLKRAVGYVKSSNTGADDNFGASVALSADGSTLAVGAYGESSNAIGIDGDQANNSADRSGAVYVFTRSGGSWVQQAYIKASNTDSLDSFGLDIALSADGDTLAVGASLEESSAIGINGDQQDNSADQAGAVYVFSRSVGMWSQQAYLKGFNTDRVDFFGSSIALSGNGDTLAVGAESESSDTTGVNSKPGYSRADSSGAAYVFTRSGAIWNQQAHIKASNADDHDRFGISIALSDDGDTLVAGASGESSNATGINGDQNNNTFNNSGAVYVFTRSGGRWDQRAYVKASNTEFTSVGDDFGGSVAVSGDGDTLAVGARNEQSNATGVGGDQHDNSLQNSGAVYLY